MKPSLNPPAPARSRSRGPLPGDRVFLVSLGCAKNRVDSEHILGILRASGYRVADRPEDAEIAVVNTCGFIQEAVEEAVDTILELSRLKKRRLKRLYVAGCMVQRYGYKLAREIPEVDGWLGTGTIHRVAELISAGRRGRYSPFFIGPPGFLPDQTPPRLGTAPFYSSYLKIAEGCSHKCTYCTIPRIRGPFRSRPIASICREAKEMVDRGIVEINLVAQDTTMYGKDLEKGNRLEDLLSALLKIEGIGWIRVLYAHPDHISERLLELLEQDERICPYLDIPLQHAHPAILKGMGRGKRRETPWRLVERIRRRHPGITLRTTLMVGFPWETDGIFEELLDFIAWARFDHLGVFVFSPEEGTAAARLIKAVEKTVGHERRDALMKLQRRISEEKKRAAQIP